MLAAHERHFVDAAVTLLTSDALGHVNAVVEVGEVRQIVDFRPANRLPRSKARAHRLEHRTIFPDELVTVVASGGGGNACRCGRLDGRVAVPAVDSEAGHVMLVTEWNGLHQRDAAPRGVAGAVDDHEHAEETPDHKHRREDRYFGKGV